jgi:hypothetical protein
MPKYNYLDLAIGAPRRLAILRRDFDQWFVKNPHAPRERVKSWRDVRFANMRSTHTGLYGGLNDGEPIWYGHCGPYFRKERFADEVVDLRHNGWYTNADSCTYKDGSGLARGIIGSLPHGKFIAGYWWGDNDERVYFPEIYYSEEEAARAADGHAEHFAEQTREDDEKNQEAHRLQESTERKLKRLRECLVLRHKECMSYVRLEIEQLVETIRKNRHELKTTYADYL